MNTEPEFSIGQQVRVILNERNRTPHTGVIVQVICHHKMEKWCYFLEENGKRLSKRYFSEDLEPVS